MNGNNRTEYYLSRKYKLLERFDNTSQDWKSILAQHYGDENADVILSDACLAYEKSAPGNT